MCTTIKYKNCMGRNFDYEISYNETIKLWNKEKYKMCGVATGTVEDYPLYYDAMNEQGLCISALNFEGNAYYFNIDEIGNPTVFNIIAPWELPVKILGNCKNINEVKEYLKNVLIINKSYNENMPNTDLHWFICDKENSIIVEQTKKDKLQIYDANDFNVMTNNPPYPTQKKMYEMLKINHREIATKLLRKVLPKECQTRGLETYGLMGGLTSEERFGRIYYFKKVLENAKNNFDNITQTFHLLDSAKQIYGATPINDKFEYTIYEIVYDMEKLELYWKLYDDMNIKKFNIKNEKI